jgi:hypothetical protein
MIDAAMNGALPRGIEFNGNARNCAIQTAVLPGQF